MFRYADTQEVSKSGELQRKVVPEIRKVTYLNDSPNPEVEEPVVSYGYETVSEMVVSKDYPTIAPAIVEEKTIDSRDPNRVVRKPKNEKREE